MQIFEHDNRKYLSIRGHHFHILNGFGSGDFIQCTTMSSSGIIKDYLPQGYELSKSRYNGQMIFTIYKKNLFNYKSKSKSLGTLLFIALSEDGAKYLFYRWLLNEQIGMDDTPENIAIVKEVFADERRQLERFVDTVKNQNMKAVSINMNDYGITYAIKTIIKKIGMIA